MVFNQSFFDFLWVLMGESYNGHFNRFICDFFSEVIFYFYFSIGCEWILQLSAYCEKEHICPNIYWILNDQLLNKQGLSVLMTEWGKFMVAHSISVKTHKWHIMHRDCLSGPIFTYMWLWVVFSRNIATTNYLTRT